MQDHVRVAAVAFDGATADTAGNLDRIHLHCRRAADEGAELVLFPELSVTGFVPNHPTGDHAAWLREALRGARAMAEPLDGSAVRRLVGIARDTGVLVAAGLLEDAGHLLHNTHVLAGPGGLLGAWRKMHVPLFEAPFYNGGGVPDVVETPLGRIGVNICFDAFLPESTRLLAVRGAELVLFPFAADPEPVTPLGWARWAGRTLETRCAENGVFGVACNTFGEVSYAGVRQRFAGGAMVVGPDGAVLARHEEATAAPHMLVADLERAALTSARAAFEYTFRFRRPELYGSLAAGADLAPQPALVRPDPTTGASET
jgi:predicted amidohydrolase